ncbi:MAG: B12-binding domain-containing radical SAM protein [Planctomycetes bacterium]|nr:B12-binding domain-containing radical SAM protein [Planctomycetota bacterium]
MPRAPLVRLAQLPVPQPARGAATGNVPLAAGSLAVALRAAREVKAEVEVLLPEETDALGDERLAERLAAGEPAIAGFSLYLWNVERSLHVARALRERSPGTRVVLGGPEVSPDNPLVVECGAADAAVLGEAEEVFPELVARLARGADAAGLPGVAVQAGGRLGPFAPPRAASFPLNRFPSPYLAGVLPVDRRRAAYAESARGCRSRCTFCFYPRSAAGLRTLGVAETRALVEGLAERGAREVVFLDPTFNHRADRDELLRALAAFDLRRRPALFAEVRAEGLDAAQADLLAAAGFTKLEIGLQSINPKALARTRRGGSPERVAAVAALLRERGIEPLVDLIVGLPEDQPVDVLAGADFLAEHGLAPHAQVFILSVLPGTALRRDAAQDGILFDPAPPYHVRSTRTLPEGAIPWILLEIEERLERRVDEQPRPWLADPDPAVDPPDVFVLDVERGSEVERARAARPGAQHAALWLCGDDLWAARARVVEAVRARLAVDPFAVLDVVLAPRGPFPLNLLDLLRSVLDSGAASYASRALRARGEDLQRRLTVVLERGFPEDWEQHVAARVPVFRNACAADAVALGPHLGMDLPGARVVGPLAGDAGAYLDALASVADPDLVAFADRALELRWVEEELALGER